MNGVLGKWIASVTEVTQNAMPQKHYYEPTILLPNLISRGWMHADQFRFDLKKIVIDVLSNLLNMLFVIKVKHTLNYFIKLDDKLNSF